MTWTLLFQSSSYLPLVSFLPFLFPRKDAEQRQQTEREKELKLEVERLETQVQFKTQDYMQLQQRCRMLESKLANQQVRQWEEGTTIGLSVSLSSSGGTPIGLSVSLSSLLWWHRNRPVSVSN